MKSREYLGQAFYLDQRVNSKLEQIASLREIAMKTTSILTDSPLNTSINPYSMGDAISKIMDLENEINSDIDKLVDLKREIATLINGITTVEYKILLELRYLCFHTWEQIAEELGYNLRWIYRMHGKALNAFEVILSDK